MFITAKENISKIEVAWPQMDRTTKIRAVIILTRAADTIIGMFPEAEPEVEDVKTV
jgi:hypothetical protein